MAIKLSNAQACALASKIKEEINAPTKEHNNNILKSDEYVNFFTTNEDCKALTRIQSHLEEKNHYWCKELKNIIRSEAFKEQFKTTAYISSDLVLNEIHLATIDAADLSSLIEAVSSKFKQNN